MGSFFGAISNSSIIVLGASTVHLINFDNGTALAQYSDAYITTRSLNGTLNYLSTTAKEGSTGLGYQFSTNGASDFRINISVSNLTGFNISAKFMAANTPGILFDFKNATNVSKIKIMASTSYVYYIDGTGNHNIGAITASYRKMSFVIKDDGSVDYHYNTSSVNGNPFGILSSEIKWVRVTKATNYVGYAYFDNLNLTYGTVTNAPDNYCGTDVSGFEKNSIGYLPVTSFVNKRYLEALYGVDMSTTIMGVSILVSSSMRIYNSNLSEYSLKVNGVEIGPADCFKLLGSTVNEDIYALYWNVVIVTLADQQPLFEFYHSTDIGGSGQYWDLFNAVNALYWNPTIAYNNPSLYDGEYAYGVSSLYATITFYYDSIIFENETSPYTDLVTCPKTAYSTFDTIPVSFFVSDFTYSNSIQLWRNGTQKTDAIQGFPYSVLTGDFFGELSYTPLLSGTYQFRLVRNGLIKSSFNVTVTDPVDMNFVLAVYPNPCEFNTEVFIYFRFYPLDGAEGFIGVSESPDTSGFSSFDESWLLSANTTGNKSFFPQTNMYVSLWKKSGNVSYVRVAIKYLKMYSIFDNTINVAYKSIQLSDAVPSVSQRIYGTQVVQGFNTFVRMNNKLLQYVTDTPFYNVYVDMSKGGNYNAELCMETANGTKVLCSVNFTVSSPAVGGGAGAEAFPPEMKLLFGICCILVAVSCPLMISVKYHVVVPTFVYVVFMAFGIGIGTVLGFLELWLVFLFVVALVAGAVFTIFGHGGQGGGGGDSGTTRKGGILSRRGGKDYATASRKADYGVSPKGSPGYLKGPGRRGY
jgi:hypothetical protein